MLSNSNVINVWPCLKNAWVRDGHGKLSSLVTQIWLLLFARLCENLVNPTGEHYFERCLCLISIWLEEDRTVNRRAREDVSS